MIVGIENPLMFLGAGVMLNLYPGPDTLYILGHSLGQGRAAGVYAALGIGAGSVVHTLLGAFGLSALLMSSASAFTILKYLGAAYLIYQGLRLLTERTGMPAVQSAQPVRAGGLHIFRQGVLTNVLNPKVALFFLAFIPQFISTASPNKVLSFLILGTVFIATGTLWCIIVAVFASAIRERLSSSPASVGRLKRVNGILFILLGFKLAASRLNT